MELYTFTQEELTQQLNKGKEVYLDALRKEGIITQDQLNDMASYSIVLANKTVLGSLWDKFFTKKGTTRFFIAKILDQWNEDADKSGEV